MAFAIEMIVLPQKEKRTLCEQARLDLIKDSVSFIHGKLLFDVEGGEHLKIKTKKIQPNFRIPYNPSI